MAWLVLVVSALFEAVWATALSQTDGFTRAVPTVVFLVGIVLSLSGLSWAMKAIPTGVAYPVWVGIGASLTVIVAVHLGQESLSWVKVVLIGGIIVCVIGLKVADSAAPRPEHPATHRTAASDE